MLGGALVMALLLGTAAFRLQLVCASSGASSAGLPIISSDLSEPVHDWTIRIRGAAYGLQQWGDADCSLYLGHPVVTLDVPAWVAVAGLLSILLALAVAGSGLLRCTRKEARGSR